MRKPNLSDGDSLEVKMTPMIDVVFLLLVFFVWTSSFEIPEYDLPGSIAEPPAGGSTANVNQPSPTEVFDEIVVKLVRTEIASAIKLNGQDIRDVAELQTKIRAILSLGVQPPVIVDPDGRVAMKDAIEVYDAVRLAGADRVLFAAKP